MAEQQATADFGLVSTFNLLTNSRCATCLPQSLWTAVVSRPRQWHFSLYIVC